MAAVRAGMLTVEISEEQERRLNTDGLRDVQPASC